jgi:hypothetical protein
MTRLDENVFEFDFPLIKDPTLNLFYLFLRWGFYLITPFFILVIFYLGHYRSFDNYLSWIIACILSLFLTIWWRRLLKFNHFSAGYLILDNGRRIISFYKWSWSLKNPPKIEELAISDILSLATDVGQSTETRFIKTGPSYRNEGKYKTTSYQSYNIALHGKFGTKRIFLKNLDDWNLFQTLISEN